MTGYKAYRGNQVDGAGPLGLILLTYDALNRSLGRAKLSVQAGDMHAEADSTSRALEALIELATSLNLEEGGEVAVNLSKLYFYMMERLSQGMCSQSIDHLDEVMTLTQTLQDGWKQLEQGSAQSQMSSRPIAQPQAAMQNGRMMMAYAG